MPLLTRIGQALHDEPGDVMVNGYTDNQPIHTVQFPSNWQLVAGARRGGGQGAGGAASRPDRPVQRRGQGRRRPAGAQHHGRRTRSSNRRTEIVLLRTSRLP